MITFAAYLVLGYVNDVILTWYYIALADRRAFRASAWGMVIPLLNFAVIARALDTHDVTCLVAFVLGNGAGTYWAVRRARRP